MTIYGYARVSTDGQTLDAQRAALVAAGAAKVFHETASGIKSDRKMRLFGVACWYLAGPGLPAVMLVALGVVGRLVIVIRAVRSLFHRAPIASGSSSRARV